MTSPSRRKRPTTISDDTGEYPDRLERLRIRMAERRMDGALIHEPAGIRYLTGFSGSAGVVVVLPASAWLVTDGRYAVQSRSEARGVSIAVARGGLTEEISRRALLRKTRRVAFDSEQVSHALFLILNGRLRNIRLIPDPHLLGDLMEVKSESEIGLLREAGRISERVFAEILPLIKPGVAECDIAGEITLRHRRYGAGPDAFEPIVASGERGALPHARATTRRIARGELVTLDFGCTVGGYHSDITRTVAVGRVPARLKSLYGRVREAHDAAIREARGGLDARALDAVARRVLVHHGLGAAFIHSLGHGLGLRVHERPWLSPRSEDRLRAGSVVTIEPGAYLPGTGGVRLETDIVLREQACELLTHDPGTLIEL